MHPRAMASATAVGDVIRVPVSTNIVQSPQVLKFNNTGITTFVSSISFAFVLAALLLMLFILLRNRHPRIFKPRTFLVPERKRPQAPPQKIIPLLQTVVRYDDRQIIQQCGLDAYFFLRYLKAMLVIFTPICAIVLPILVTINYVGGRGHEVNINSSQANTTVPAGLNTLAWGNIAPQNTSRYNAHLVMAIMVVIWVCTVFFFELRVYIKIRQDYMTSAQHRLRASATTVLVNSIPRKWLSEDALIGLFDVFPGGVRNVWLNRNLTKLLDKMEERTAIHLQLEAAETKLIRDAKRAQLKQKKAAEGKRRRELKLKTPSKQEKAARAAEDDAEANRVANNDHEVELGHDKASPHTLNAGTLEMDMEMLGRNRNSATRSLNSGFMETGLATAAREAPDSPSADKVVNSDAQERALPLFQSRAASPVSDNSTAAATSVQRNSHQSATGNTARHIAANSHDMIVSQRTRFWQFWKPPSGAYVSPVPQGEVARDYMASKANGDTPFWTKAAGFVLCAGGTIGEVEYPLAHNPNPPTDEDEMAEWRKWLKEKDRPTHHLPPFRIRWLPGLPLFSTKVDTIYWCRQELARLNVEIAEDQRHPERFPLITSAFVQFNNQVAAHMACQSIVHHVPRQMSPRMNEISPHDVLWNNMAITWWQEWLRTVVVGIILLSMLLLWTTPVAWTTALGNAAEVAGALVGHELNPAATSTKVLRSIAGPLPAIVLWLLLALVPNVLNLLAELKGVKTEAQRSGFVQKFYFLFLFYQVFLVVSIASFFAKSIDKLVNQIIELRSVNAVLALLANNLPAAANYFFGYMILQAMSTSASTLLQSFSLFKWFIWAPMVDSTARDKWQQNTSLSKVQWSNTFPTYTNIACIALVYCVISPLISVFAIITFSLMWVAQRYAMLYVYTSETDTGGVLYPRAINQTFTGLYFMELCMAGLFFIVRGTEKDQSPCTAHGIVMGLVAILTMIYQLILNRSFSPLFQNLPITFEDEAVFRDEAFQRAQDIRFGLAPDEIGADSEAGEKDVETRLSITEDRGPAKDEAQAEEEREETPQQARGRHLRDQVKQVGAWAKDGGQQLRKLKKMGTNSKAAQYRREQRQRDLEAQRARGDVLFSGAQNDVEDLTPEERDLLTRHAFQHRALRERPPTVWIPRDDLGVSEDEIRRTHRYSEHIRISDDGTALDSKVRVIFGKRPPDFSELDIINLWIGALGRVRWLVRRAESRHRDG